MNLSSWGFFSLSILQTILLRTVRATLYQVKGFRKKQENNAIINKVMDDILLNEQRIVSTVNHEATGFLENDDDENDLYQVENMSIDETKEFFDWCKRALE